VGVLPRLVAQMRTIVPGSHGEGVGLYRLPSPCGRWWYGHAGGTPGYITWVAGSSDGRRIVVMAANGVGPDAIAALDRYLDELVCR
jgi:D-alanyl-D-alanine carboxypeptidase